MSAQEQQELQYGEVASVKRSHGFIRRCNSALDLFFHFNELDPSSLSPGDVRPGLAVQFIIGADPKTGRPCAKAVARAPEGAVSFEEVLPEQLLGQIIIPLINSSAEQQTGSEPQGSQTRGPQGTANNRAEEGSTGVIRYLAPSNKPAHVTFKAADIQGGPAPAQEPLPAGSLVYLQLARDKRASASHASAHVSGGAQPTADGARAGLRAVNVQPLPEGVLGNLGPQEQMQLLTLQLLRSVEGQLLEPGG